MTNKERAIAVFKNKLEWEKEKRYPFISKEEVEAYKMAIQALEQEPCKDVIMTNEEQKKAIDALKISTPVMAVTQEEFNDYIKTVNKIMDLLEQEPCDDAVSRQAFDEIKELMTDINGDTVYAVRMSDIRQLPSVNPSLNGDAVSRQAVLDYIHRILNQGTGKKKSFEFIQKYVGKLPPVYPQEKTGHWILQSSNKEHGERDFIWWKCSECGQVIYSETEKDRREYHAFCGRCGANMSEIPTDSKDVIWHDKRNYSEIVVEPQESEE